MEYADRHPGGVRRAGRRPGLRLDHRRGAHPHPVRAATAGRPPDARRRDDRRRRARPAGAWRPHRAVLPALRPAVRWLLFGDEYDRAALAVTMKAVGRASLRSIGGFRAVDRRPAPAGHPRRAGRRAVRRAGRRPGPAHPAGLRRVDRRGAARRRAHRLPGRRAHADAGAPGRGDRRARRGGASRPRSRQPAPSSAATNRRPERVPRSTARPLDRSRFDCPLRVTALGGKRKRSRTDLSDATVLQQEIAAEQQHVDRVYARLVELRAGRRPGPRRRAISSPGSAPSARWSSGTRWSSTRPGAGTPWTPSTRAWSSAGSTCDTGAVHYVGRMGIRGRELRSRWSSTGGRRPRPRSTGPPPPTRWAWSAAA